MPSVAVIIPNLNGLDRIRQCLESLAAQTLPHVVFVVENGSTDGSEAFIRTNFPDVRLFVQPRNLGFAGGVNVGLRIALDENIPYAALLNNDAVADPIWLERMVAAMEDDPKVGIVCPQMIASADGTLDDVGEAYSVWGLPFALGRGLPVDDAVAKMSTLRFGASGGASLYRSAMLREIGLFDEDFFAYYEDVDISFRAQLAGWKVRYLADAVVHHQIGQTSSSIKGFITYQTIKNYPWIVIKNVPGRYLKNVIPRLVLAQLLFIGRAFQRRQGRYALHAMWISFKLIPKKLRERKIIKAKKIVSDEYIWSLLTHDLPPNAHNLRKLRQKWWKLRGKHI